MAHRTTRRSLSAQDAILAARKTAKAQGAWSGCMASTAVAARYLTAAHNARKNMVLCGRIGHAPAAREWRQFHAEALATLRTYAAPFGSNLPR